MYYSVIRQFHKSLQNLDAVLGKAAEHAQAKKFDANNYVQLRLAPDMLTFAKQIQIASDMAKGAAASLAGKTPPKFEDNETTLDQLRERLRKTASYLEGFQESDFAGVKKDQKIAISFPAGKAMKADDFTVSRAIPNFFFHITTAYALLRAAGVDIGKMDFLGQLNMFDA